MYWPNIVDHPKSLTEYRPVCLASCMYKIIPNIDQFVLANRSKGVLGKLISKNQTIFVQGRDLVDGVVVLVVNEIIDLAKSRKVFASESRLWKSIWFG